MKFDPNDLDLTRVAAMLRDRIKRNIDASGRWDKTGHLLKSLKLQFGDHSEVAVTVANDRLQDARLMDKFQMEIVPHDLDFTVLEEIKRAIRGAIKTEDKK